jgi:HAD superfamily hydrolase (TIGR01509 family)
VRGALIFDFDGLIIDTESPEFQTWLEIFRAHGVELDLATWAVGIGTLSTLDPYAELERRVGHPIDRAEVRAWRKRRHAELLALEPVRPGVLDYIAEGRRLGMGIGVASSSPRSWVADHLTRLGIIQLFDSLSTSEDVVTVKPDPALYLVALGELNAAVNESIAFEDSPNGILAAKRAGLYCVAVPNPLTGQLPLDLADRRLHSMADVPLTEILQRLPGLAIDSPGPTATQR